MIYLVTGTAGFIGFHLAKSLLEKGLSVIGVDNLNSYYDVELKNKRLSALITHKNFKFYKQDICEISDLKAKGITHIIHLAAQAGVRYSLTAPMAYSHSNLHGHLAMLEYAKSLDSLESFVYASSSSVYGANEKIPFTESDRTDNPVSLYAATKKSCEIMSESYHQLYKIPMVGLRFFTVYGEWGRPDMSPWLFTDAIINQKPLTLYNNGESSRDYTYIDDIVAGIEAASAYKLSNHEIFNLGGSNPISVKYFLELIENITGKKAIINHAPMQKGDVEKTYADITKAQKFLGYNPKTSVEDGMQKFIKWFNV